MGGYSDDYKDRQRAAFVERWAPAGDRQPALTAENLRYNVACRRAAEHELREIKAALAVLKGVLK